MACEKGAIAVRDADNPVKDGELAVDAPPLAGDIQADDLTTAALAVKQAHRSVWGGLLLHTVFCLVPAAAFLALYGWPPKLDPYPLKPGITRLGESIVGSEFGALEIVAVLATIAIAATVSRSEKENSLRALGTAAGADNSADRTRPIDLNVAAHLVRVETFAALMYLFTTLTAGMSLALCLALFIATSEYIAAITVLLLTLYLMLEAAAGRLDSTTGVNKIMQLRNSAVADQALKDLGVDLHDPVATDNSTPHCGSRTTTVDRHIGLLSSSPQTAAAGTRRTGWIWIAMVVALLITAWADWRLTDNVELAARAGLLTAGLTLFLIATLQQLTQLTSLYTFAIRLLARVAAIALVWSIVAIRWSLSTAAFTPATTDVEAAVGAAGFLVLGFGLMLYALGRTGAGIREFARIDLRSLRPSNHDRSNLRQKRAASATARVDSHFSSGAIIVIAVAAVSLLSTGLIVGATSILQATSEETPPTWWVWWAVNCVIVLAFAYAGRGAEPGMWVLSVVPAVLLVIQFIQLTNHVVAEHWLWWPCSLVALALPLAISALIVVPTHWLRGIQLQGLAERLQRPVRVWASVGAEKRCGIVKRLTQSSSSGLHSAD